MGESLPPLKIVKAGQADAIPVYSIELSNNLSFIRKGAVGVVISATTGSGIADSIVYAATANKYAVLDFATDLINEFRLVQSGNSVTVDTTGNLIIINAVTNSVTGVVYAQSGDTFLTYGASTNLTAERIIAASDNITIISSGTSFLISANTNNISNLISAEYLTYAANATLSSERVIAASDNITIVSSGTSFLISAITNALGTGTVNTGSQNYLAFYPTAGTTVDDVTVSVSTGNGVAPFNVIILTSPAASLTNGDFWFESSSNKLYLACRSTNSTYYVELGS